MGNFRTYITSDPPPREWVEDDDLGPPFSYRDRNQLGLQRMGTSISIAYSLFIGVSLLTLQHLYFMLTATSSLEYGMLQGVNPFFLGHRKSEK